MSSLNSWIPPAHLAFGLFSLDKIEASSQHVPQ